MNKNNNLKPICVIDTGVGGLSVVNALIKLSFKENIYYFADTANLPYGYKSKDLIKKLSFSLIQKAIKYSDPKLIVIACHTISVVALEEIQKEINIPIIGMLNPSILGLSKIIEQNKLDSLGILSTKATFDSKAYFYGLKHLGIKLNEKAVGSLVSLVEENCFTHEELIMILSTMLPDDIKKSDALLLGCTHFSALAKVLKSVCKDNCLMIDAADIVAAHVMQTLEIANKLSFMPKANIELLVTDNPERFKHAAKQFMQIDCEVKLCE